MAADPNPARRRSSCTFPFSIKLVIQSQASGHDLPLFRTLDDSLVCCPQARLRTFPVNDILGTRGDGLCWIEIGCQKRGIQVALYRPDAARTLMKPLRE